MFPALCPSYFPPVFRQWGRRFSIKPRNAQDSGVYTRPALAPLLTLSRPYGRHAPLCGTQSGPAGKPAVMACRVYRRGVACRASLPFIVSCRCVSSCRRQVCPVDVYIIARQVCPVNTFFKSFSQSAHQGASPIFDDRDKEGKCPTRDIMKERPTNNR